jgi:hypothetical protein
LPRSSRLKALGVAPLRPDPSLAWTCPIRAAGFSSSLPQSPAFRAREEYLQFRKSKARRRSVDGIANASGTTRSSRSTAKLTRPQTAVSSRLNSNPLGSAPTQVASNEIDVLATTGNTHGSGSGTKSSEKNPPDCVLVHCAATRSPDPASTRQEEARRFRISRRRRQRWG